MNYPYQKSEDVKFHHVFVPGFNGWTTIHLSRCDYLRLMAYADENERLLNKVFKVAAAQIVATGIRTRESGGFSKQVRDRCELMLANASDVYELIHLAPLK